VLPPDAVRNVEQMIQKHVHGGFGPPGREMLGHKSNHDYAIVGGHKVEYRVWHVARTVKDAASIAMREHDWRIRTLKTLFCGVWRNVREVHHHS
jgi:hypothetical protein